mgnify:FL=1
MPHLSIEYSPTLEARADIGALCRDLHAVLLASDHFPTAGIRIRTHRADHAIVADGHPDNDFLTMTLSVGAGRSTAQLQEAGGALFAAAQAALRGPLSSPHFALSLEIRVIDPDLSWKDTPIHARLSGKA